MDNSKPFRLVELGDDELDDSSYQPPAAQQTQRRRASTEPVAKIDLNSATLDDLEALPGVGPLRARRILAWRERNGVFESVDDLRYVRGMGARLVMELAPYLTVQRQPPPR